VQVGTAYGEELTHHSRDRRVGDLAAKQHGVISLAQLVAAGFTKNVVARWVAAGRLHRIHRGVYAVGHTALTAAARDLAAVLACGPGAVLSHRSAGVRLVIVRYAPKLEVTVPGRRVRRPGIVVRGSTSLEVEDRGVVDRIPITSPARTIVDLAEVLTERRLADAIHEAEVQRIFDLRKLEGAMARVPGRAGRHKLRRVIAGYDGGPPMTRTEIEILFLRLCIDYAIPRPLVNIWIHGFEVDFYWPDAALVVETDGAATHLTRKAFHEDRRRDRILAANDIQVLRVTWRDLRDDPAGLAGEIRPVVLARQAARRPKCAAAART
jgi:Transcriptional regulator, AbiEi antitoxin/Protein of unknown function (DUF559)